MASRYTRDEILAQGLELCSSPTLIQHDIPNGIVQQNAYCIKWLQNALDMFYRKYPFSSTISTVALSLAAGQNYLTLTSDITKYLPDNFIIDVRNGILVSYNGQFYRLKRLSFQYLLNYQLSTQNATVSQTFCYSIVSGRILISPIVNVPMSLSMYYYALPTELQPQDHVDFPDEWCLIEFIRLKGLEWTRSIDVGTAEKYLQNALGDLRAAGLIHDSEYDTIPIENNQVYIDSNILQRNSWMGPPVGFA